MRKILTLAIAMLMAIALAAPAMANGKSDVAKATKKTDVNIVTIATESEYAGDLQLLVAALGEAGLVEAIAKQSQKTVFAPTDQAFINTFNVLLGDENGPADLTEDDVRAFIEDGMVDLAFGEGALETILLYHVIGGRLASTSVLSNMEFDTKAGLTLTQGELVEAGLLAEPVLVNFSASNGIVHVLTEGVLIPSL